MGVSPAARPAGRTAPLGRSFLLFRVRNEWPGRSEVFPVRTPSGSADTPLPRAGKVQRTIARPRGGPQPAEAHSPARTRAGHAGRCSPQGLGGRSHSRPRARPSAAPGGLPVGVFCLSLPPPSPQAWPPPRSPAPLTGDSRQKHGDGTTTASFRGPRSLSKLLPGHRPVPEEAV